MKETMTIHRGLAEIKVLRKRIEKKTNEMLFITSNKHSSEKINGITIAEMKDNMKSDYESLQDLIKRCTAIERAIKRSNVITEVTISGEKMTIVDAINMKQVELGAKKEIISKMRKQWKLNTDKLLLENGDKLEQRAELHIQSMYGSKEKANAEEINKAKTLFIESQTIDLIDPLDLLKLIGELTEEVDKFESEVDSILSESNALTNIIVEY